MFPSWVQVILGVAALLGAGGVIWRKAVSPIFHLAQDAVIVAPIMRDMINAFGGTPSAMAILAEIVAQFRNDSGSTLLDKVDKLTDSGTIAAKERESARELASDDRRNISRILVLLDILGVKADMNTEERAEIAAKLEVAQSKVEGVASKLEESQVRADASLGTEAGEAADAAARSGNHEPTVKDGTNE